MILGNDISAWQRANPRTNGDVDFRKMRAAGSRFCYMRAQFGLKKDVDFGDYWRDCKEVEPRGGYYFPITQYNVDEQTSKFCEIMKPDIGEMPPVIDVETYQLTVPNAIEVKRSCLMIEDKLGVRPTIYTGLYVWRDQVKGSADPFFKDYDLWLPNYNGRPLRPTDIPKPWTKVRIFQFGLGKGRGLEFGVESLDIDMDEFLGTEEEFMHYTNGKVPILDPVPVLPTNGLILTAQEEMNVRTGPGIRHPKIGTIPGGATIKVASIAGSDAWAEISSGRWTCIKQGDDIFYR